MNRTDEAIANRALPCLTTPRLRLTLPPPEDAQRVVEYYTRNREHLRRWDPMRTAAFYDVAHWERRLADQRAEFRADRAARFFARLQDEDTRIVASCNLSAFVRGPFQACFLGYSIDAECEGRGLMSEALGAVIQYAFESLGLHRIQANYVPQNERSARLLERLGFVREGVAQAYLLIDGAWRDHVLTSLTNENWQPSTESAHLLSGSEAR